MAVIIAIEGLDGSGKRTLATGLAERVEAAGGRTALMTFPRYGQSPAADGIRLFLENPTHYKETPVKAIASLFAVDRLAARDDLMGLLGSHDVVLLDRYTYSNVVYQCARVASTERGTLAKWIKDLEFGTFALPQPTLNLLIDIPPALARHRTATRPSVGGRAATDHFEADEELLRTSAALYRDLAAGGDFENGRWATVNVSASTSPSDVVRDAWNVCEPIVADMGPWSSQVR